MVNVSNSTIRNILKMVWYPNSFNKWPTTVWNIYFGPIEQTVCPNTTGGDQQKWESKRGYYFFLLIPFGDKVLSFLIQKLSLSCLLLSSHVGLWSIMVTFSLPKESWWPVVRCLLSGRSGLQFASLLWPVLGHTVCSIGPKYIFHTVAGRFFEWVWVSYRFQQYIDSAIWYIYQ